MNWKMFGFLMVLLAGLSFAAVYSDAYMERTYQFQLCKIDYGEATLGLASGYNPTLTQQAQLDTYLAALENDKDVLATATSKRGLTSLLRTSNSNFQKASSLYYKIYYPYVRSGGISARNQVLAERRAAMEEYSLCRLCVIRPTDSRCRPKCSLVEGSETVSVGVDVPGYNPGKHYFSTPIGDTSFSIGGNEFSPFEDVTVENTRANKHYVERQSFSASGTTSYDGSLSGVLSNAEYSALFDADGNYGIPLCPGDELVSLENCGGTDKLEAQKMYVKFLKQDWVVSGVGGISGRVPSTVEDGETYQVDGATLYLAKEAYHGIMHEGQSLPTLNGYSVRLDDISREVGMENAHAAIITVLDANGNPVCQDQVWPGETNRNLCGTGVMLHVYQTAPGLNFIARWADMAVYYEEIELVSGESFAGTDWNAQLQWANRYGASEGDSPGYLRQVSLVNAGDIGLADGGEASVPSQDGSAVYLLGMHSEEGNTHEAFWAFSSADLAMDELPEFALHEGETLTVGTTGVTLEVLSIDTQLTPDCSITEDSTATFRVGIPGYSDWDFTAFLGQYTEMSNADLTVGFKLSGVTVQLSNAP